MTGDQPSTYVDVYSADESLPTESRYVTKCEVQQMDERDKDIIPALSVTDDGNIEVDMTELFNSHPDDISWFVDNIKQLSEYISRIVRKDSRTNEKPYVDYTNYNDIDEVEKVDIGNINTTHVNDVIKTDVQISHIEKPVQQQLSAAYMCQRRHVTYYTRERGEKEKRPPACDYPHTHDSSVDNPSEVDKCNCKPHRKLSKDDFEKLDTQYFSGLVLKLTTQQMVLSQADKSDFDSITIGAEVDEHMINRFDNRDKISVMARVLTQDNNEDDNKSYYLHILGAQKIDQDSLTEDDIEHIEELSDDIDPIEDLSSVIGQKEGIVDNGNNHINRARKALLISLVKGNSDVKNHNIHTLLFGKSGSGKSTVAKSASKSVNGETIDMQKASPSGITGANVQADELGGKYIVQSGTLTQASGSVCQVDELDKTKRDSMQQVLGEPMEDGLINIDKTAKAELPADVSIIATANPEESDHYTADPIIDCCPIVPHILDRFDLICRVDPYSRKSGSYADDLDSRKDSIVSSLSNQLTDDDEFDISTDVFQKYIKYAKDLDPKLNDDSIKMISRSQVRIEKQLSKTSERLTDTLVNISTAIAKLHLSDEVTEEHVEKATEIYINCWDSVL